MPVEPGVVSTLATGQRSPAPADEGLPTLVVDIADVAVVAEPTILVTYTLGSCIGVTVWDPDVRVGGLLHYMLPDSHQSPERGLTNPAIYCDTGLQKLFHMAYALKASKRRLRIAVAGGSQLLNDDDTLNIGRRNYLALRKIFWKNGIEIQQQDVGGSVSRSMRLNVQTGEVLISTRGKDMA